jgi:hypothetical protein
MRGKKKVGQRPLAPFKGSGGEGRKVWRRVEAERERKRKRGGALGVAWTSAMAWCRRGSGPTTTRAGDALPRDNGGWRGRRDADDVADRWAGTRRGRSQLGAARGSAALTGGADSTVCPIRFSNRIKFISNGFKFAPNI